MAKPIKHDPNWARAKNLCRLNMEDIRKAKELGFKPRTLIKNVPSSIQPWKLPVKLWIRELHEKRFGPNKNAHTLDPELGVPLGHGVDVPF